jgi:hypothetical protein
MLALVGGGCLAEPPGSFVGDSGQMLLSITAQPHCQGVVNFMRVRSAMTDAAASVDDAFVDDYPCAFREAEAAYGATVLSPPLPLADYRVTVELIDPTTMPEAVRAMSAPLDLTRDVAFGDAAIEILVECDSC